MSEIRPPASSILFPPQAAGPAPARTARSDFFKAALEAVQAAPAEPVARAPAPRPSPAAVEDHPTRPGALLDIRV